jgi:hypothetical protein
MKNIIWAAMPKLLTMVLLITVLMFISGAQRAAAQCGSDDCSIEDYPWSVPQGMMVQDTNHHCVYFVQVRTRQCIVGGVPRCEFYFDKIENGGGCCSGVTWPSIEELTSLVAKAIFASYPYFVCNSTTTIIKYPSCWKITTANTLAEACITEPCCILQGTTGGTSYPVSPPGGDTGCPSGCTYVCQ